MPPEARAALDLCPQRDGARSSMRIFPGGSTKRKGGHLASLAVVVVWKDAPGFSYDVECLDSSNSRAGPRRPAPFPEPPRNLQPRCGPLSFVLQEGAPCPPH
eukprot:4298105-Pyramimonas_sp.AAC.1